MSVDLSVTAKAQETEKEKLARLRRELLALTDLEAMALGRLFHTHEFSDLKRRLFPREW